MRGEAFKQLSRQWAIMHLLSVREYSAAELAAHFRVGKTTIERDLTAMLRAGLPLAKRALGEHAQRQWWSVLDWARPVFKGEPHDS